MEELNTELETKFDLRIREHADRENRSCNIMVYNFEESTNTNPQI